MTFLSLVPVCWFKISFFGVVFLIGAASLVVPILNVGVVLFVGDVWPGAVILLGRVFELSGVWRGCCCLFRVALEVLFCCRVA